jgi:hypothetical protein
MVANGVLWQRGCRGRLRKTFSFWSLIMALLFPSTDSGLLAWANHFSTTIAAGPPTIYGLTSAQSTSFATTVTAYQTALTACEPTVRNRAATAAKNSAKASLKLAATQLANIIYGQATVSDAQKIALGLTVRAKPTPIPAPAEAPALEVVIVTGRTVKIRLHNSETGKRGRPAGVTGATVFTYIGATPPSDASLWTFQGSTSKTVVDIAFSPTLAPGTEVWVIAYWCNGKLQSGPPCSPVPAYLAGGSVSMAA